MSNTCQAPLSEAGQTTGLCVGAGKVQGGVQMAAGLAWTSWTPAGRKPCGIGRETSLSTQALIQPAKPEAKLLQWMSKRDGMEWAEPTADTLLGWHPHNGTTDPTLGGVRWAAPRH